MPAHEITHRLRRTLTGSPDTPCVALGNFEVEEQWARGELGLPKVRTSRSNAVVGRMDEFTLFLADSGDAVVLKERPDDDYLAYLDNLQVGLPEIVVVARSSADRTVTEDALDDPDIATKLDRYARRGAHLWPHGVSAAEERLAAVTHLPLAVSGAKVCKEVNSKIYSRLVVDQLGLRQPEGTVCRNLDEFDAACRTAHTWLAAGRSVVLKDAFGVSGKGILVVRDAARLKLASRMIHRQAVRHDTERLALVMEEWLPKRLDLNYQFTVGHDGSVHFDVVKEALTKAGVHQGHRMPADLDSAHLAELRETADSVGLRLAGDGYTGVVGIDAIITVDDVLHPVIEINARNNMSTYQERLRQLFFSDGQAAVALQHRLALHRRTSFGDFRRRIDDLLLSPGGRTGVIVHNFATVNAEAPSSGLEPAGFQGRLYAIAVAPTPRQADALSRALETRLGALTSPQSPVTGRSAAAE
ncbi:preATP grasp domain-containing protein [Streptomyces europaeiscabiei]|uniref:preATP grasp domain-containing protein n=1 Tax=Streptomyces europaeiscabiei TaxID=146819 RepID=UPI0029BECD7D|nr:ATP-grasp domain-containing protein [Streptomyces europaeiscabiei]MDX2525288.1 ATP-grasp domain-containing protein [Streptomyces europaeiscabiei]